MIAEDNGNSDLPGNENGFVTSEFGKALQQRIEFEDKQEKNNTVKVIICIAIITALFVFLFVHCGIKEIS